MMHSTYSSKILPSKPTVSVIIPTLNEAKNLPLVLPYIPMDIVDEVILVDGRSTDHTVQIALRLLPSIKIVLETTPGKGAALQRGYVESTGDILIVLDADGSHDPREIPRYLTALLEGADFVKGSRFAPMGGTTDMPWLRKMGNWGFTKLVNILFGQTFSDLCYGYHAFWRYCLDYLDLQAMNGFEIDTAIYLQAVRGNLKVVDMPSFEGYRFYGEGKLKTFPDGWRVLRTIFREWSAKRRQAPAGAPVGFRNFRPFSPNADLRWIPVTGSTYTGDSQAAFKKSRNGRKRITLEEFFRSYIGNSYTAKDNEAVSEVLLHVIERLGASSGSLVITSNRVEKCQFFRAFGRTIELVQAEDMGEILQCGVTSLAIQGHDAFMIENTASDSRWLPRDWEIEEGVARSAIVVPFANQGQGISVLVLSRPMDRQFSDKDLDRIRRLKVVV